MRTSGRTSSAFVRRHGVDQEAVHDLERALLKVFIGSVDRVPRWKPTTVGHPRRSNSLMSQQVSSGTGRSRHVPAARSPRGCRRRPGVGPGLVGAPPRPRCFQVFGPEDEDVASLERSRLKISLIRQDGEKSSFTFRQRSGATAFQSRPRQCAHPHALVERKEVTEVDQGGAPFSRGVHRLERRDDHRTRPRSRVGADRKHAPTASVLRSESSRSETTSMGRLRASSRQGLRVTEPNSAYDSTTFYAPSGSMVGTSTFPS